MNRNSTESKWILFGLFVAIGIINVYGKSEVDGNIIRKQIDGKDYACVEKCVLIETKPTNFHKKCRIKEVKNVPNNITAYPKILPTTTTTTTEAPTETEPPLPTTPTTVVDNVDFTITTEQAVSEATTEMPTSEKKETETRTLMFTAAAVQNVSYETTTVENEDFVTECDGDDLSVEETTQLHLTLISLDSVEINMDESTPQSNFFTTSIKSESSIKDDFLTECDNVLIEDINVKPKTILTSYETTTADDTLETECDEDKPVHKDCCSNILCLEENVNMKFCHLKICTQNCQLELIKIHMNLRVIMLNHLLILHEIQTILSIFNSENQLKYIEELENDWQSIYWLSRRLNATTDLHWQVLNEILTDDPNLFNKPMNQHRVNQIIKFLIRTVIRNESERVVYLVLDLYKSIIELLHNYDLSNLNNFQKSYTIWTSAIRPTLLKYKSNEQFALKVNEQNTVDLMLSYFLQYISPTNSSIHLNQEKYALENVLLTFQQKLETELLLIRSLIAKNALKDLA